MSRLKALYTCNSAWSDITPLEQDEASDAPVKIAYSKDFNIVMGYFRAMLAKNELSERALALCKDAIRENPANYTAWIYLLRCIKELQSDLQTELAFCVEIQALGEKNYQLWHHRRELIALLGEVGDDLKLTANSLLKRDDKNYHVWSHRQWLLVRFDLYDDELTFIDTLLDKDVLNNSAWNQRWFVLTQLQHKKDTIAAQQQEEGNDNSNTVAAPAETKNSAAAFFTAKTDVVLTAETLSSELQFAEKHLRTVATNASAWRYLEGLTIMPSFDYATHFEAYQTLGLLHAGAETFNLEAHSFLLELYLVAVQQDTAHTETHKASALRTCDALITGDAIRAKYWTHRKSQI